MYYAFYNHVFNSIGSEWGICKLYKDSCLRLIHLQKIWIPRHDKRSSFRISIDEMTKDEDDDTLDKEVKKRECKYHNYISSLCFFPSSKWLIFVFLSLKCKNRSLNGDIFCLALCIYWQFEGSWMQDFSLAFAFQKSLFLHS